MRLRVAGLLGTLAAAAAAPLAAHPISMTAAEVDVRKDGIEIKLRVMVEDLVLFHGLKSDSDQRYAADTLKRAAGAHRGFILKFFSIRDSDGEVIEGQISEADVSELPSEGVARVDLMKHEVRYSLDYPCEEGESFLTFTQKFGGEKEVVPAVMDFSVTQNGIWLDRPVQLSAGKPHTVAFDWENPPDKPPKNWRALKRKKEEEFQRRLGITRYTGIYSYVYVTDREIRHEILVPLLSFEEWLPLSRADPEFLEVGEQIAARDSISEFLRGRNKVEIDGAIVEPVIDRLQFFGLDINDFAQSAEPRRVGVYQARLGMILVYPTDRPPETVKMTWNTFSKSASFLKSTVYVGGDEPEEAFFTPESPQWAWEQTRSPEPSAAIDLPQPYRGVSFAPNFLTIALVAAGLCWLVISLLGKWKTSATAASMVTLGVAIVLPFGQRTLEREFSEGPQVTEALLRQTYRAFDQRSEEAIYDALATSVRGGMLEDLYVEFRRGLEMESQGGAVARVKKIDFGETDVGTPAPNADGYPEFDAHCRWQVSGTVEHWGHIHTRKNAYEAVFTIAGSKDGWRMTDYEIRNAQLLRSDTELRL